MHLSNWSFENTLLSANSKIPVFPEPVGANNDNCDLECGIALDSCDDKFPSPSVDNFYSLGSEISNLNSSMVDCWLSSLSDFSLTSLSSLELKSLNNSCFSDDAYEEGVLLMFQVTN